MNSVTSMDQTARDIMHANDKGGYTVPTHGLYPYQWNWDSAFAAYGFAQFDVERAWVELETLFSSQWDNGMVPHIIFHQQGTFSITINTIKAMNMLQSQKNCFMTFLINTVKMLLIKQCCHPARYSFIRPLHC